MKVRDSAMGMWFARRSRAEGIEHVFDCLLSGPSGGVFWDIIEHYNLKAKIAREMAELVYDKLLDFEMDQELREKADEAAG